MGEPNIKTWKQFFEYAGCSESYSKPKLNNLDNWCRWLITEADRKGPRYQKRRRNNNRHVERIEVIKIETTTTDEEVDVVVEDRTIFKKSAGSSIHANKKKPQKVSKTFYGGNVGEVAKCEREDRRLPT